MYILYECTYVYVINVYVLYVYIASFLKRNQPCTHLHTISLTLSTQALEPAGGSGGGLGAASQFLLGMVFSSMTWGSKPGSFIYILYSVSSATESKSAR